MPLLNILIFHTIQYLITLLLIKRTRINKTKLCTLLYDCTSIIPTANITAIYYQSLLAETPALAELASKRPLNHVCMYVYLILSSLVS